MKLRCLQGVLMLLISFWGVITFADQPKDSTQPPSNETKVSHFEKVRVATMKQEMSEQKRDELTKMFNDIAAGVEKLKGKTPWAKGTKPTAASIENLKTLLKAAAEKVHPEVAAAVLFDTAQDDYVRQIALSALINYKGEQIGDGSSVPAHKGYTMAHLSLLCNVLVFISGPQEAASYIYSRIWTTPETARVRIAQWIGHVLGVDVRPKKDDDTGPLTTNLAASNPRLWLKNVLQYALTLEHNKEHEKIIRSYLEDLK